MKKLIVLFLFFNIIFSASGCSLSTKPAEPSDQNSSTEKSASRESETVWVSTPNSSVFTKIGYNEDDELLLVVFRDSDMTYEYKGFSKGEWDDFIAADSKGRWYNAEIKPYYDYSDKY